MLLSEPTQVIDNNQVPQLIYQQSSQGNQISDGQIQYIIQEEDLQSDNFSIVQPATQQVFYSDIPAENGAPQIIQHHGQPQQQFHQQQTSQAQLGQQQIVIQYPQQQQQILLTNSGTTTTNANIAQVCPLQLLTNYVKKV